MINRLGNTRIEWYDVDFLLWGSVVPPATKDTTTRPWLWDIWGIGPRGQKQQPFLDIGASGLYVRKLWATQLFVQEDYTSGLVTGLHGGFHTQVSGLYPIESYHLATKGYIDYKVSTLSSSLSGLIDVSGIWTSGMFVAFNGTYFVPTQGGGTSNLIEGSGLYQVGNYLHVGSGYAISGSTSGIAVDISVLDVRYALSGSSGSTYTAGSGLDLTGTEFNISAGWGLSGTTSGLIVYRPELDIRYSLSGNYQVSGDFYPKLETDARYVNITGDVMTGSLYTTALNTSGIIQLGNIDPIAPKIAGNVNSVQGGAFPLTFYNASGLFQMGALNPAYWHMHTDRASFYFYKSIVDAVSIVSLGNISGTASGFFGTLVVSGQNTDARYALSGLYQPSGNFVKIAGDVMTGDLYTSGLSTSGIITLNALGVVPGLTLTDINPQGNGSVLLISGTSGYIRIGAQNTSFLHFQTDRPNFYFYQPVFTATFISGGGSLSVGGAISGLVGLRLSGLLNKNLFHAPVNSGVIQLAKPPQGEDTSRWRLGLFGTIQENNLSADRNSASNYRTVFARNAFTTNQAANLWTEDNSFLSHWKMDMGQTLTSFDFRTSANGAGETWSGVLWSGVLILDGPNRKVGINNITNPLFDLHVSGQIYSTNDIRTSGDLYEGVSSLKTKYALSGSGGNSYANISGIGTSGYLPSFASASGLVNSRVRHSGTVVLISGELGIQASGFRTAVLNADLLTDNYTYQLPDGGGTLALINSDYGLSYYDGSTLEFTPATGPGIFRLWADDGDDNYFQYTLGVGASPTCTFSLGNAAGGRWVFADPGSTGILVRVAGEISGTVGHFGTANIRNQDTDARYALSGRIALSGLIDVTAQHAFCSGEVLSYNGSKWTNGPGGGGTTNPEELHRQFLPSGETLIVAARYQILVYGSYEEDAFSNLVIQPSGSLVIL